MFWSWQLCNNSIHFSNKEEHFVKRLLEILIKECPKTCAFISTLDIDKLNFYWAPNMTVDNGIMGAWLWTKVNNVYLANFNNIESMVISKAEQIKDYRAITNMDMLLTPEVGITLVHELIHKFQFKTSAVLYLINRLLTIFIDHIPYIEQFGIEYDARHNSETVELTTGLSKLHDAYSAYVAAAIISNSDRSNALYKQLYENYVGTSDYKYLNYAKELFNIVNTDK